jgi:hypothetical protein
MELTKEQEQILLERDKAYENGEMKTFSVEELKVRLNYTEK